ncbi:MAG: TlpA family protein disulfide reductase [Chloroflexi bacterium]|nr:MAG: TlpA family protein disulfide reductase [Chloroflexota bacterium]
MTDLLESSSPAETETPSRHLPVWVIVLAFLALAGFMTLIGWGLSRSMRGSIAVGDKVPNFSLTTFDGKPFSSDQYAGKVVLVNFWASWCKPCEQEARELEEAYQQYKNKGDVVFVGLAYVDTEPNSLAYLEKFGITYANGPDLATKVSQMFRVRGVPETYVIDRQGRLAYVKIGPFSSTDEITAALEKVLAE